MSINPIFQKEWLKLKRYTLALTVFATVIGCYFWFDLNGQYANIEPESMMWYRFSHLGDKPYDWLMLCFIACGTIVATCQFVPEIMGKKIRILTHLPISLSRVVISHVLMGCVMLMAINGTLALFVTLAFNQFYPANIIQVSLKDMLLGQLPAIAVYLGLTAAMVESNWSRRSIKLIITLLATYVLTKQQYQSSDLVWVALLVWMILPIKDSFLSVKTRRIENRLFIASVPAVMLLLIFISGTRLYSEYSVEKSKFYLFYSALLEDFVYQENGPHHTFFYGTPDRKLTKEEFEASLPFVYWKNLDIQKKLPVEVNGHSYDKQQIRNSRMSLQFDHKRHAKPEVALFPLFNPISDKGAIRFPENAIALQSDRFEVYTAETAQPNAKLAREVNALAAQHGVKFPIEDVWGKTTNMKPFDWGYFIKDSEGKIFNLNRADNVVAMREVQIPTEVGDIAYIQVSENRHKKFYGYAISKQSEVYLISYPNYQFIPLEMDGFDYTTMSFQLLSDPIYYLMRFNDGEKYHAIRYSKDYQKLDSVTL